MSGQLWSWLLSLVGLTGFYFAGKKVWWSWYINIGNQVLWLIYSLVTKQYGFLVATAGYSYVFIKNAIAWTREKDGPKEVIAPIAYVTSMTSNDRGVFVEGILNAEAKEILRYGDVLGTSLYKQPEIDLTRHWNWRRVSPWHIWRRRQEIKQIKAQLQEPSIAYAQKPFFNEHRYDKGDD